MPENNPKIIAKLQELESQDQQLAQQLTDPKVIQDYEKVRDIGIQRSQLSSVVENYKKWRKLDAQIQEDQKIISAGEDDDLVALAQEELPLLNDQAHQLLEEAVNELVTADDKAINKVILEVRAGTGGDEAGLWAGDILSMYQKYAQGSGWKSEILEMSAGDQGGIRQAVVALRGPGVWQGMGYEGGVHCVKRVPATETQGRIHTSTASVAVLPEPEQVEVNIADDEVDIYVTTAQGPGGQNVNKVATAVHMIHKSTGIEVRMQESKSQHQNRQKAWQLLRARVYDHFQREKQAQRDQERSKMIGTAGRSERIRTYRYKDNIAVDHRLCESFNLQTILDGQLTQMVEKLIVQDRTMRLAAL